MAEDRKYFIFNKPMDYRRGTVDRMNAADGILRLTGAEPGCFFSRVLDSREEEMTWHRLRTVCAERDGGWNMTLYSSDSRFLVWGDNSAPVDEVLADPELSLEEKKQRMSSCFAKEIRGEADVLLFDNPTQGVDVGAKAEIYKLMLSFAKEGKAVIFNTLEIPEIQKVADRCVVFYEGRIVKVFQHSEVNEHDVMLYSTNAVDARVEVAR